MAFPWEELSISSPLVSKRQRARAGLVGGAFFSTFTERDAVTRAAGFRLKALPLFYPTRELLFSLDVCGKAHRRRVGVILHHGVLIVELVHCLDDLALADMGEQII